MGSETKVRTFHDDDSCIPVATVEKFDHHKSSKKKPSRPKPKKPPASSEQANYIITSVIAGIAGLMDGFQALREFVPMADAVIDKAVVTIHELEQMLTQVDDIRVTKVS